jgi:hypothetical protein
MTSTDDPIVHAEAPGRRTRADRRRDAIARLENDDDVWVSTASPDGVPHLVPVSLCWHDGAVLVAVPRTSPTAGNVAATGRARLAVGHTRDVVMVDAAGVLVDDGDEQREALLDAFASRTQWDIRNEGGAYVVLHLTPERIQAWRNEAEIVGRTLMKDGLWLD